MQRPDGTAKIQTQSVLEIQPFSINPLFHTRGITYRKTEHEYKSDYYREYLIPPAQMIEDMTRQWLDQSGLFAGVFRLGSLLTPEYILEGHVDKAYMDISKSSQSRVILEISFYLLKKESGKPSLMLSKSYTANKLIESVDPELYFEGMADGMTDILTDFEKDLELLFGQ